MTSTQIVSLEAPAIRVDLRRSSVFLSLIALAFVLRIYAIALYPLGGDEYFSLAEAKLIGLNWNSIVYSTLMHFWIRLGSSELWLRLPAAIFGTASVAILFKLGEKLGGWRTGVVAGLLAATSPYSIYHSQEVRFYSFFICASAAFLLATINYVDAPRAMRNRLAVLVTGIVLFFAHFLGPLAVYAQGAATVFAKGGRSRRKLLLVLVGVPVIACGLLLLPPLHHGLWRIYQAYGNAPSSAEPVMTSLSLINLAKVAFAGFIFIFGYHIYPLRLLLVITGAGLSGFLLLAGAVRLWRETKWAVLSLVYFFVLVGVYVVLETAGGRLASGVSPRHVAFVWPVFLIVLALGLASFSKPVFQVLLVAVLGINALAIRSGWQQDWTYGTHTDYRSAAAYASRWAGANTALLNDGRSEEAVNFYFPNDLQRVSSSPYLYDRDVSDLLGYQRLVFVTDDWESERRRAFDQLLTRLNDGFACVDGRVDYPLFEYVLERKSSVNHGYALRGESNQMLQPLSIYGLEFQDLRLPVAATVKDVSLNVIGGYGLPDAVGRAELGMPLAQSTIAKRIVLLTNVLDTAALRPREQIAELVIEDKFGKILKFPLRLDGETAAWDKQCESRAPCQTVFQWHKRMAIVGQNGYAGALRDFQAGLHGVALDLPMPTEVATLNIRYTAGAGRLFIWGIALPN